MYDYEEAKDILNDKNLEDINEAKQVLECPERSPPRKPR